MRANDVWQIRMLTTRPCHEEFCYGRLAYTGRHTDAKQTCLPLLKPLQCPCKWQKLLSPGHIEPLIRFPLPLDVPAEAIKIPRSIEQKQILVEPVHFLGVLFCHRLCYIPPEISAPFMRFLEVLVIVDSNRQLVVVHRHNCAGTVFLKVFYEAETGKECFYVALCPFCHNFRYQLILWIHFNPPCQPEAGNPHPAPGALLPLFRLHHTMHSID